MVLMAQPFSFRYPLVEGQGNWGAPDDPKSFAAMRYTEARLSPYAALLLDETRQGTVDFVPNFDGSLNEPVLLPARVPMLLLNGGTGIAVGMATDIPPHTHERGHQRLHPSAGAPDGVARRHHAARQGSGLSLGRADRDAACRYSGGLRDGAGAASRHGRSMRAENGSIIISALPHLASPAKVLEQIAHQMRAKKLPMLADLRDESDHRNPTRLVLVPRSNRVDCDRLMSHLFATTDLERSYRVNLNVIGLDQRPRVKNLVGILKEWLECRQEVVTPAHPLPARQDQRGGCISSMGCWSPTSTSTKSFASSVRRTNPGTN